MTLNNDTRISKGFVTGLLDPRLPADAGIVGPMVDDGFPYAVDYQKPEAANYSPRPQFRMVPAVEGTALMISRECWEQAGGLDLPDFKRYGWGNDLDLALRARKSGYGPYTTEMAYINHFGRRTANTHYGSWRYELGANVAMLQGLRRLHGFGAALAIMRQMGIAHDRRWHKPIPLDDATHQSTD